MENHDRLLTDRETLLTIFLILLTISFNEFGYLDTFKIIFGG